MVEFVKKHKIPLIIMAGVVGLYLLYDYLSSQSSASANTGGLSPQDAADQAALQSELGSLQAGSDSGVGGGSISSPIATSPAITGTLPSTATNPGSTGTVSNPTQPVTQGNIPPITNGILPTQNAGPYPTGSGVQGPVPMNLGVAVGGDSFQQEQDINTAANLAFGSPTANADLALYQGIETGNKSDIAAMNNYNALFTEQDPGQAAEAYAAGSNPFLQMLAQGVAGPPIPNSTLVSEGFAPNPTIFQYPTSETDNTSESSGGTHGNSAGPGGSSSAILPAPSSIGKSIIGNADSAAGVIPSAPIGGPASVLSGAGNPRQLTTIPPSPATGTARQSNNPLVPATGPAGAGPQGPAGGNIPVNPLLGVRSPIRQAGV